MNDETKCEKNNLNKNKTKTKDNVLRERTNTEKERKKLNSPTIWLGWKRMGWKGIEKMEEGEWIL